jgi:hypothetical protein
LGGYFRASGESITVLHREAVQKEVHLSLAPGPGDTSKKPINTGKEIGLAWARKPGEAERLIVVPPEAAFAN